MHSEDACEWPFTCWQKATSLAQSPLSEASGCCCKIRYETVQYLWTLGITVRVQCQDTDLHFHSHVLKSLAPKRTFWTSVSK